MPDLEDLYREIILDHYRSPRNSGELPVPPAHRAEGYNPNCGDVSVIYVDVEGGRVADVRINGQGCSISQASASMMSAAVKGKTLDEVRELDQSFGAMMSVHASSIGGSDADVDAGVDDDASDEAAFSESRLGDLAALRGVVKFPIRIKCARLPWITLTQALDDLRDADATS